VARRRLWPGCRGGNLSRLEAAAAYKKDVVLALCGVLQRYLSSSALHNTDADSRALER
jgi:hypothetical protein